MWNIILFEKSFKKCPYNDNQYTYPCLKWFDNEVSIEVILEVEHIYIIDVEQGEVILKTKTPANVKNYLKALDLENPPFLEESINDVTFIWLPSETVEDALSKINNLRDLWKNKIALYNLIRSCNI